MKPTFTQWMNRVNAEIETLSGLSSEDLEDFCYQEAFDDGESAVSVAREVLEDNGYDLQTKDDNQWTESYRD